MAYDETDKYFQEVKIGGKKVHTVHIYTFINRFEAYNAFLSLGFWPKTYDSLNSPLK